MSRREGLIGGIGGFFQKRCVEVDARPGGPRIDVYDEEPELPPVLPSAEAVNAAAEAQVANSMPAEPTEQHPVRNDAATREGLATPQCSVWSAKRSRSPTCSRQMAGAHRPHRVVAQDDASRTEPARRTDR